LIPHIKKVGYTAFYEASESDHRGAFYELSDKIIDNKIELKQPEKRQIGSKSKKEAIYRYKQEVHCEFTKQKIYQTVDIIVDLSHLNCEEVKMKRMLDNVDRKITKIMLKAEKNNAVHCYDSEWSVALHQQALLCKYWARIKNGMENGVCTNKQTTKIYKQLDTDKQK
jgi:hypothetical protein